MASKVKITELEPGATFKFQGNTKLARYVGLSEHDGHSVYQWQWLGEGTIVSYRAIDAHLPYVLPNCAHAWEEDSAKHFVCARCGAETHV